MKCRKNLSNPNVKDCMQCEYQYLCKMESILGSAKEISNIHTESTKGIMNKIDEIDTTAERKIGPLWNIFRALVFSMILAAICLSIGYACNGHV